MTTLAISDPVTAPLAASKADVLYEIVDGRYVELPPMSTFAGLVTSRLTRRMGIFAETQQLGEVVSEILFGLTPTRRRRPDVAFVSYQRWARGRPIPSGEPWPVVPNLGVEVVSPTDDAEPLMRKVVEYFQADVEQVWLIYPLLKLVYVYESLMKVQGFTEADELDGGSLLPGFKLVLSALFADAPVPESDNGAPT